MEFTIKEVLDLLMGGHSVIDAGQCANLGLPRQLSLLLQEIQETWV